MTREEAIELLVNATYSDEWQGNEQLTEANLMAIKALQAEPAKHGKWEIDEYGIHHCPFCYAINNTVYKSFCPNCGAKMDKEKEE